MIAAFLNSSTAKAEPTTMAASQIGSIANWGKASQTAPITRPTFNREPCMVMYDESAP